MKSQLEPNKIIFAKSSATQNRPKNFHQNKHKIGKHKQKMNEIVTTQPVIQKLSTLMLII